MDFLLPFSSRQACAVAMALLLAGCMGGPDNIDEPQQPSVAVALLTASAQEPTRWDVQAVQGREPQQPTLDAIASVLEDVGGKGSASMGAAGRFEVGDDSAARLWSSSELHAIVHRISASGCGEPTCIHFVFLNGAYQTDQGESLGAQIANVAFVFPDRTKIMLARAGGLGPPNLDSATVERYAAVHELGHLLGLVNNGAPMQQHRLASVDDDPCQCHSTEVKSPMYYRRANQFNATLELLMAGDSFPSEFTEADWQDLRAYQARLGARIAS